MRIDKIRRDVMKRRAAGDLEPQPMSARERKQRINSTLKHWAYLGKTYIPHPTWTPRTPGSMPGLLEFHLNATHSVQVYDAPGGITHLMVRRHDEGADFPWYVLQHAKNSICGEERVAVEVFPAESQLVDQANIRHLWVYPAGHDLGFGLHQDDDDIRLEATRE